MSAPPTGRVVHRSKAGCGASPLGGTLPRSRIGDPSDLPPHRHRRAKPRFSLIFRNPGGFSMRLPNVAAIGIAIALAACGKKPPPQMPPPTVGYVILKTG